MRQKNCLTICPLMFLSFLPTAANAQIALDPYKNSSVLIHHKVPSDRATAGHWLVYLTDMAYSGLSPELANSWAHCYVTDLDELTDGERKHLFLDAKRREFQQLSIKSLQAKIRHGLAKRQARKKAAQNDLLKAATELAEVARKYSGTESAKAAKAALKRTGYVVLDGEIVKSETVPWFGIRR